MTRRQGSYITKTKHGVYYFQIRISISEATKLGLKPPLFRKSLRTKNKGQAIHLARRYWNTLERKLMMGDKSSTDKSNNDYQEFLQIEEESQHQELYEAGLIRSALSFTERYNAIAEWDALEREHLWMSMTEAERVAMEWVSSEGIDLSAYRAQTNMAVGSERHDETIQKNTNQTELLSNLAEKHSARLERKGINPRTIKLYRSYLKTFIEYVGDRQSCELTYRDVEKFVEVLPKIPTNRNNGRYQGLSIDQIIEQQFGTYNTLAKNTLKEYARTIRSFLQEFVKKGYIDPISATAIEKEFTTKEKNPYLPFDKSDLEKLFYSDEYLKGKHTKASNYWAPLLALFTGARSNEICQLLVSDIRHEKIDHRVVTYIDINEEEDKELKTPAARRVVPIHSKLIELGFLGYVETVINQGSNALFPEIKVVNGKHNHALGRWFRDTYKRKCGIEDIGKSKKVFHSFRHTAVQHLWDSQGYELSRIGELVGHTHTTITGGYTHTLSLAKKAEMIEAMDYGIDFSRIRLWRPK